eukprot:2587018-Prymnesium_polylepis.1
MNHHVCDNLELRLLLTRNLAARVGDLYCRAARPHVCPSLGECECHGIRNNDWDAFKLPLPTAGAKWLCCGHIG